MASDEDEDREESSEVADADDSDAGGGADAAPVRDEAAEIPSGESRRKLRAQLEAEMEAFLKRGGRIEVLESAANAQGTSFTAGVNDLSQ
jgi:hypothetical protein